MIAKIPAVADITFSDYVCGVNQECENVCVQSSRESVCDCVHLSQQDHVCANDVRLHGCACVRALKHHEYEHDYVFQKQ